MRKNRNLTQFQTVTTWLTTISNSSQTKDKYSLAFARFLSHTNINPDTLVEEWRQAKYKYPENQMFIDKYTDIVQDYYSMMCNRENCTTLSANTKITSILSFFQFHRIPNKHGLDIRKQKNAYVKYHNRDIRKSEIKRILEHSGIREKAFYLMMVESGLRPNTLCQLKYKHIKEEFEENRIPMKIDIPAEILKDRVGNRFTFIGEDGYNALKEYLSPRGKLEDNDYLFIEKKRQKTREYLSPETFSSFFKRVVLKLGLAKVEEKGKPKQLRLYCLKKYWYNRNDAEEIYRKFWAGWSLGTQGHYLTRDVEKHRQVYAEAYESLRIYEHIPIEVTEFKDKLEIAEEEIKALKKQVEYLSSPEYLRKTLQEAIKFADETVKAQKE